MKLQVRSCYGQRRFQVGVDVSFQEHRSVRERMLTEVGVGEEMLTDVGVTDAEDVLL